MLQSSDHDFRMLINGEFVAGASTLEVINPATGKLLTRCARADKAQLDAAVLAAKNAFASWSTHRATALAARRGCGHHALELSAHIVDDQSGAGIARGKHRRSQARIINMAKWSAG